MQGRRTAGKKRGLVAAPQSLQPRAGASQPRDAGPHASERGARKHESEQNRLVCKPWTTEDATWQQEAQGHVRAGLTRHVGGAAARSYDSCGRGANSRQCGQGLKPTGFFYF